MSDYVTLLGTEDVRHAGHNMQSAASDMVKAANQIDESLFRFTQRVEEWLTRLEQIANQMTERSR